MLYFPLKLQLPFCNITVYTYTVSPTHSAFKKEYVPHSRQSTLTLCVSLLLYATRSLPFVALSRQKLCGMLIILKKDCALLLSKGYSLFRFALHIIKTGFRITFVFLSIFPRVFRVAHRGFSSPLPPSPQRAHHIPLSACPQSLPLRGFLPPSDGYPRSDDCSCSVLSR